MPTSSGSYSVTVCGRYVQAWLVDMDFAHVLDFENEPERLIDGHGASSDKEDTMLQAHRLRSPSDFRVHWPLRL
eukprot:6177800-Pleurochrysis_carterae.AAC.1